MRFRLFGVAVAAAAILVGVAAASVGAAPDRAVTASTCKRGTVPAIVNHKSVCLAVGGACLLKYNAIYGKKGFICVAGHLRKRTIVKPPPPPPPPTPPPPPPPRPPAQTGHYAGTSSQNEQFFFDVAADGSHIDNLGTGQVNESCSPQGSLSGGNLQGFSATINPDGSFSISVTLNGNAAGQPSTDTITINGKFSGAAASGTFVVSSSFNYQGTDFSCSSGMQTWTATRS